MLEEIKDIVFKDQPNGNCLECKWNMSAGIKAIDFVCDCPLTHINNKICIMKMNLVENGNTAFRLGEDGYA